MYTAQIALEKERETILGENISSENVRRIRGLVEIETIDGVQGRECQVVLHSNVRSNPGSRIGFLNNRRRANAALTRAKNCLAVLGSQSTLLHSKVGHEEGGTPTEINRADQNIWLAFEQHCQTNGLIVGAGKFSRL